MMMIMMMTKTHNAREVRKFAISLISALAGDGNEKSL